MRDPKTHAKVLARRANALYEARNAVPRASHWGRWRRLVNLSGLVEGAISDHHHRTGWIYHQWTTPPHWRHTTIIPDTEETAS